MSNAFDEAGLASRTASARVDKLLEELGGLGNKMQGELMAELTAERAKKKRPWWHWVVGAPVFVALTVALGVLDGWAVAWLWWWFVVPLGLPMLGMAHALGLGMLVCLAASERATLAALVREKPEKSWRRIVGTMLYMPLWTVAVGYVAHLIMGA